MPRSSLMETLLNPDALDALSRLSTVWPRRCVFGPRWSAIGFPAISNFLKYCVSRVEPCARNSRSIVASLMVQEKVAGRAGITLF